MRASIDTLGTLIISADPLTKDTDNYALARWAKDWQQKEGVISIVYEAPGGKQSYVAVTPSNSISGKPDITGLYAKEDR